MTNENKLTPIIEQEPIKLSKRGRKNEGRPTVMTRVVLAKLELCFAKGYNDFEAYSSLGISKDAFYDYKKSNPEYAAKIDYLKGNLNILAKETIYEKILEKDVNTAKWQLERRAKDEYSLKTETQLSGETAHKVVYIDKEEKEAYEAHILAEINEEE